MKNSTDSFTATTVLLLSTLCAIANVAPIIGSSLLGYVFGRNENRHKRYKLTRRHHIISMTIGGLLFL
jgi:hypothetical protein